MRALGSVSDVLSACGALQLRYRRRPRPAWSPLGPEPRHDTTHAYCPMSYVQVSLAGTALRIRSRLGTTKGLLRCRLVLESEATAATATGESEAG